MKITVCSYLYYCHENIVIFYLSKRLNFCLPEVERFSIYIYTYLTDWSKLIHGYVIRRIDKLRGMIVYVLHVDRHWQVRRNLRAKTLKCVGVVGAQQLRGSNITRHSSMHSVLILFILKIGTNQLSQFATKKEFICVMFNLWNIKWGWDIKILDERVRFKTRFICKMWCYRNLSGVMSFQG